MRRDALIGIIRAPEFNEIAFRNSFSSVSIQHQQMEADIMETMVGFIKTLSADERKQFADHLNKAPPMMPPPVAMPK